MPRPKYETRTKYFAARDAHDRGPLPSGRLLFLELVEVDQDAGHAHFTYEVSREGLEVWSRGIFGFASRNEVVEEAGDVFRSLAGEPAADLDGELFIPLSDKPQLVQLEVRDLRAGGPPLAIYWVQTMGRSVRTFRYTMLPEQAVGYEATLAYLRIREDGEIEFVDYDRANAELVRSGLDVIVRQADAMLLPCMPALDLRRQITIVRSRDQLHPRRGEAANG